MAILNSGTNTTVQQLVHLMAALGETLGNRAGLLGDPVVLASFAGDLAGGRATSGATPRSNLGSIAFASETEGTGVAVTDPTFARDTVVVAGRRLAMSSSDLYRALQMGVPGGEMSLIEGLLTSCQMSVASVIAALASGYSTSEGTSGAVLTLVDWLSAQQRLAAANGEGPTLGVLHSRQAGQLRLDALTVTGGQAAFSPAANGRPSDGISTGAYNPDFFGSALFVNNAVAASGGDRIGMMVNKAGFKWAIATPEGSLVDDLVLPPVIVPGAAIFPGMLLRRVGATGTGVTSVEGFSIFGAAEAQDLGGTGLISVDA